jgi:hypothetical protein
MRKRRRKSFDFAGLLLGTGDITDPEDVIALAGIATHALRRVQLVPTVTAAVWSPQSNG